MDDPGHWSPAWGGAIYSNGVFTVTGAGADIWNTADSFRFVYVTTNNTNRGMSRLNGSAMTRPYTGAGIFRAGHQGPRVGRQAVMGWGPAC